MREIVFMKIFRGAQRAKNYIEAAKQKYLAAKGAVSKEKHEETKQQSKESLLSKLNERLIKGEISEETYKQIRTELEKSG